MHTVQREREQTRSWEKSFSTEFASHMTRVPIGPACNRRMIAR